MTKTQKLDRLSRAGYIVVEHPNRTIKYTAGKYEAKSLSQLFKLIFGYP